MVTNVHEIKDGWRVDILILTGDEHTSDAHKLEVVACDTCAGEVAIYQVHCDEEGFWEKFEF